MELSSKDSIDLICSGAKLLTGYKHRIYIAEVTLKLCNGNARLAESHFGWGRETIRKGMQELESGEPIPGVKRGHQGRQRTEEKNEKLAKAIRDIAEPKTQTDPELKSERRYLNYSAAEVLSELEKRGWEKDKLPAERTMRRILNRMGYRLKRIQKGRPLKKIPETDAIFENVHAVKETYENDPETLEISADTKAKVAIGDYSRGGKKSE